MRTETAAADEAEPTHSSPSILANRAPQLLLSRDSISVQTRPLAQSHSLKKDGQFQTKNPRLLLSTARSRVCMLNEHKQTNDKSAF